MNMLMLRSLTRYTEFSLSTFFLAFIELLCRFLCKSLVRAVFTKYMDLVHFIFSGFLSS